MELERRYIERNDFPQARRGYDPAEVDRHLRAIAGAIEELKSTRAQSSTSLAGAAAGRVEAIVAAAEASAREIEEKANADAKAARDNANREAAERVAAAEEMVASMLARSEELRAEVEEFVTRVGGLKAAVDDVRREFDAATPSSPAGEPLALAVPESEPELDLEKLELAPELDAEPLAMPEPEPQAAPAAAPAAAAPSTPAQDGRSSEGARLIALNMALSGTPREETARYLRENFNLDDQDDLLDEVYARAGS